MTMVWFCRKVSIYWPLLDNWLLNVFKLNAFYCATKSVVKCNNHETEEKRKETEIVVLVSVGGLCLIPPLRRNVVWIFPHREWPLLKLQYFQSQFWMLKIIWIFLDFLCIEQYHFKSTFFCFWLGPLCNRNCVYKYSV